MNKLQKDYFILPGDLGDVSIGGSGIKREISSIKTNRKEHSTMITLSKVVHDAISSLQVTEDVDFELVEPKQITNE